MATPIDQSQHRQPHNDSQTHAAVMWNNIFLLDLFTADWYLVISSLFVLVMFSCPLEGKKIMLHTVGAWKKFWSFRMRCLFDAETCLKLTNALLSRAEGTTDKAHKRAQPLFRSQNSFSQKKSCNNFSLSRLSFIYIPFSASMKAKKKIRARMERDIFSYLSSLRCLALKRHRRKNGFVALWNLKYACRFAIKSV